MKAKRIISCILMLLMLVSLMPAGFAEVGDWDPTNNGVYPDWQSATGQGQGTTPHSLRRTTAEALPEAIPTTGSFSKPYGKLPAHSTAKSE